MITLDRLSERYGEKTAVADLSLEVGPGKDTGFLGPDGAGKTATELERQSGPGLRAGGVA